MDGQLFSLNIQLLNDITSLLLCFCFRGEAARLPNMRQSFQPELQPHHAHPEAQGGSSLKLPEDQTLTESTDCPQLSQAKQPF